MDKQELYTKLSKFDELHNLIDETRKKNIIIPKADLLNLLMDHSNLVGMLSEHNVKFKESIPRKRLKK